MENYETYDKRTHFGVIPKEFLKWLEETKDPTFKSDYFSWMEPDYVLVVKKTHSYDIIEMFRSNPFTSLGKIMGPIEAIDGKNSYILIYINTIQACGIAEKLQFDAYNIKEEKFVPFKASDASSFVPFSPRQKHLMMEFILYNVLEVDSLTEEKVLIDHFRIHQKEGSQRCVANWGKELWSLFWKWLCFRPCREMTELNEIAYYFGEETARYFAWLTYYCTWLIILSLPGIALEIYVIVILQVDSILCPFYCILLSIWFGAFQATWKKRDKELTRLWNLRNTGAGDTKRANFAWEYQVSIASKTIEKTSVTNTRMRLTFTTFPLIFFGLAGMIFTFVGIRVWTELESSPDVRYFI